MSGLYLSGPMKGVVDHNFPAFMDAAERLRAVGYVVSNPAEYGDEGLTWEACLRRDLHDVLNANGVALLPGWDLSRGAQLEVYVAQALGMDVLMVDSWIAARTATEENADV